MRLYPILELILALFLIIGLAGMLLWDLLVRVWRWYDNG